MGEMGVGAMAPLRWPAARGSSGLRRGVQDADAELAELGGKKKGRGGENRGRPA